MTVVFARETPKDFRAEVEHVAEAYAHEMRHFDHPLRVDWSLYQRGIDSGAFHFFTVRVDGELRGLSVMIVRPSALFAVTIANQDLLWLHPDLRGQMVGAQFLAFCDEALRQAGAEVVYRHTRLVKDFGPLLERLGYEAIDASYGRRFVTDV